MSGTLLLKDLLAEDTALDVPTGGHNDPFPARDGEALAAALEGLGASFRWNLRANWEEMTWPSLGPDFEDWERTTDRASDRLKEEIARRFFYKKARGEVGKLYYGREAWRTSLNAYLQPREVDPVRLWLDGLTWDGTPRLDTLLIDMFGAEETDLTRWASRYCLLGPVQRTFEPGCKLDEFVVLIGGQGTGKSAFVQGLIPEPMRGDLFSDGLRFDAPPDKQRDAVAGRLIVEVAEWSDATGRDRGRQGVCLPAGRWKHPKALRGQSRTHAETVRAHRNDQQRTRPAERPFRQSPLRTSRSGARLPCRGVP